MSFDKRRAGVRRRKTSPSIIWMLDENMHFLDLCHIEIEDNELRDCEIRFNLTFRNGAAGNNPQEIEK